jgi:hypothetical protein
LEVRVLSLSATPGQEVVAHVLKLDIWMTRVALDTA